MNRDEMIALAAGLSDQQRRDLTSNWDAFCDADPLELMEDVDGFPDRLEALGYAECVPVDADALEDAFAEERGIYPGGMMWQLTPLGIEVRALAQSQDDRND